MKEAKAWIAQKTPVFIDENNQVVQHFKSWNADAFYFNDAGGNIVEFIVRYDLANETQGEFDNTQVLGVNEMGMPHQNVKQILEKLQHEIKTERWKGDLERFGTSGTQEGIFLIPNYKSKDFWFPTKIKIEPVNFEAVIENKQQRYLIEYKNEIVSTQKL